MSPRRLALLAGVLGLLACGTTAPSGPAPQAPAHRYTPQQARAKAMATCRGLPKVVLPCYMRLFNEPAQ